MPPDAGPIADIRLRVLALIPIAFGFSTVQTPAALALMAVLTLCLVRAFCLGFAELGRRLRVPGLVVAGLVAILPFTSGRTVLASLGPLAVYGEGLAAATAITLRFLCIVSVAAALLATVPMGRLIAALRALGLPSLMTDMALLTLRHAADFRRDFGRMRTVARLRGASERSVRTTARQTGRTLASLMLRSHGRSERVYHAMILRGHGAHGAAPETFEGSRTDIAWLAAMLAALALILVVEHWP